MNQNVLKQYVLFAVVTILVGLITCEIICSYYPEMDKFHSGDNKYLCIGVLAITGLVLRYLLTTKMRGTKLKSELNKLEILDLDENNSVKITELVFKELNNNIKISYPDLDNHSDELESLYKELDILIKEKFCLDVKKWYET